MFASAHEVRGSMLQKTVVVPQLQSIEGRRLPFRGAVADSHGLDCSADHRYSPVARGHGGRFPCCAGRPDFPVVVQRHVPMVRLHLTTEISQLLHKVIDVPVCLSCRSFTSLLRLRGGFPRSRLFVGPQ